MPEWSEEINKRLAGLKLEPAREAEIAEELAQHLEDRYQELLAGGLTEAEARRTALDELSGRDLLARELLSVERTVSQEPASPGTTQTRGIMVDYWQDLRYGGRMCVKNPGFTVVAVLTLALGSGVNTTIFSLVSSMLLRKPPVRDPDRLMMLLSRNRGAGSPADEANRLPVSAPDFLEWRLQATSFSGTAALSSDDSPGPPASLRVSQHGRDTNNSPLTAPCCCSLSRPPSPQLLSLVSRREFSELSRPRRRL